MIEPLPSLKIEDITFEKIIDNRDKINEIVAMFNAVVIGNLAGDKDASPDR